MSRIWMAGATMIALVHGGALAQETAPARAHAQPSVQQQFEAGSSALAAQKWEEALAAFQALEQRLSATSNRRSLAIVQVRKGEALARLGREEEAAAALAAGLPHLPKDDPTLVEDRLMAELALGQLSELSLDYAGAVVHYRAADSLATDPVNKVRALGGLIRTGLFQDAPAALADAERALALVAAAPGADKALTARFRALKGRVLMNMGRLKEAREELKSAVDALGGLTLKVDAADLATRGDLALVALLQGDEEAARRYLAYTGAGRTEKPFIRGTEVNPPSCDEYGLQPDDVAVVQFAIAEDGSVIHAAPIYASRQGQSALAFARAASSWSWAVEDVKDIPPLLRLATRVEMRCTTAVKRPSLIELMQEDVSAWMAAKGLAAQDEGEDETAADAAKRLHDSLAREEAASGKDALALLPILLALANNAVTPSEERRDYLGRANAIARAHSAPPPVLAYLAVTNEFAERAANATRRRWKRVSLAPLLADPVIAGSPRAAAAIRLLEADALAGDKKVAAAKTLLVQVRDTAALPPQDNLRVGALVRLASLELASGDKDAARTAFEASGLDAQQCALVDAVPAIVGGMPTSNAFPIAALRWGFEGWTVTEFDITADGKTQDVRTTISYPPFVFSEAGRGAFEKMRYRQTYRPDGGLGCGANSTAIVFRLPD